MKWCGAERNVEERKRDSKRGLSLLSPSLLPFAVNNNKMFLYHLISLSLVLLLLVVTKGERASAAEVVVVVAFFFSFLRVSRSEFHSFVEREKNKREHQKASFLPRLLLLLQPCAPSPCSLRRRPSLPRRRRRQLPHRGPGRSRRPSSVFNGPSLSHSPPAPPPKPNAAALLLRLPGAPSACR